MELTARFQIPMLIAGQAQKEFFHNEALERISMLLCPVVGETLQWRSGSWEAGIARAREVRIGGETVLRRRQPDIPNPAGGATVDSESRTAVTAILGALRAHGMIG